LDFRCCIAVSFRWLFARLVGVIYLVTTARVVAVAVAHLIIITKVITFTVHRAIVRLQLILLLPVFGSPVIPGLRFRLQNIANVHRGQQIDHIGHTIAIAIAIRIGSIAGYAVVIIIIITIIIVVVVNVVVAAHDIAGTMKRLGVILKIQIVVVNRECGKAGDTQRLRLTRIDNLWNFHFLYAVGTG